jgi:hypothetical protein
MSWSRTGSRELHRRTWEQCPCRRFPPPLGTPPWPALLHPPRTCCGCATPWGGDPFAPRAVPMLSLARCLLASTSLTRVTAAAVAASACVPAWPLWRLVRVPTRWQQLLTPVAAAVTTRRPPAVASAATARPRWRRLLALSRGDGGPPTLACGTVTVC